MLLPIALPTGSLIRNPLAEHDRTVVLKALHGVSSKIETNHTRKDIIDLLKADISALEMGSRK